jgi:hypothetical protein
VDPIRTASDLLRALTNSDTAPEPPAPSYDTGYIEPAPYDPLYDPGPVDPVQEAVRRADAAVRAHQAAREARIRALVRQHLQAERDARLLRVLLAGPTPEERAAQPVKPCDPARPLRFDYRGPLGGV